MALLAAATHLHLAMGESMRRRLSTTLLLTALGLTLILVGISTAQEPSPATGETVKEFYEKKRAIEEADARLVFIPGVLGSAIEECADEHDRSCKLLWGTLAAAKQTGIDLKVREGKRYRTSVIDRISFKRIYRDFLEFADQLAPYQSRLDVFDYDWRLSNAANSKNFGKFLCLITERYSQSSIYIVAHSMGGLVLRHWMHSDIHSTCKDGQRPQVRGIAFVATPHAGSAKAVLALMNGYSILFDEWPWPFSELAYIEKKHLLGALNRAGPSFPSLYELFPIQASAFCSTRFSLLAGLPIAVMAEPEKTAVNIFDHRVWTRFNILDRLEELGTPVAEYEGRIAGLLRNAEVFLCAAIQFNPSSAGIDLKYIFGRGRSEDTAATVSLTFRREGKADIAVDSLAYGDKTVPMYSAIDLPTSLARQHIETVASHLQILGDARVKELVRLWLMGGRPNKLPYVTTRKASLTVHPYPLDVGLWHGPHFHDLVSSNKMALEQLGRAPPKYDSSSILGAKLDGSAVDELVTIALMSPLPEGRIDAANFIARYAYLVGSYSEALDAAREASLARTGDWHRAPAEAGWRGFRYVSAQAVGAWAALRLEAVDEAEQRFKELLKSSSTVAQSIGFDGEKAVGAVRMRKAFLETYDWPSRLFLEFSDAVKGHAPPPHLAQQPLVAGKTIEGLEARVAALKQSIDLSSALIASKRGAALTVEKNISTATKDIELLTVKFKEIAAELEVGGPVHKSMTNALAEIDKHILEFSAKTTALDKVAKHLETSRDIIKATDASREATLVRILSEIRRIEADKRSIEAFIVMGNYKSLAERLTQMLDGLEALVDEASAVNKSMDTAAKSLRPAS
jgi:hypothetical protein